MLLTGLAPVFADTAAVTNTPAQAAAAKQHNAKVMEFKDILFKLVRQDEFLDEAIETLDSTNNPAGPEDISALNVSLRAISKNLRHISALNRTEFSSIQAGSSLSNYTNTILSYSRKIGRKAGQVNVLAAQLAAKNKKSAMRDAVSSGKGGKKVRGKELTQVLEEQKAVEGLSAAAKSLNAASRDLTATSKWLHIASQ